MKTISKLTLALACTLLSAGTAYAASNPSDPSETTSVGSSDISVTVPVLYKISGIADLPNAGSQNYAGSGTVDLNDNVCIFSNDASTRQYKITLHGSTTCTGGSCPSDPTDVFAIANDTNNQEIPYQAYWNDTTGTAGRTAVGSPDGTEATTAATDGASLSINCGGGNNANVSVVFTQANLVAVKSGIYTGTLTITLLAPT